MKGPSSRSLPVPVEADIDSLVKDGASRTGFSQADIIRSGLRRGVPAFVEETMQSRHRHKPACLEWLDDYPLSPVPAKSAKAYIRRKLHSKYGHDS
jgi:hypothetical protein